MIVTIFVYVVTNLIDSKGNPYLKMFSQLKKVTVVVCCLLIILSSLFSTNTVLCQFESETNLEMHHSPKVIHNHEDKSEYHIHFDGNHHDCHSELEIESGENCSTCYDSDIINLQNLIKINNISFDYQDDVTNVTNIHQINKAFEFVSLNIENTTYYPEKTVLRI